MLTTYQDFKIEVGSFPSCGEVTIVDNSVWPTPNLWPLQSPQYSFGRTDVKLVLFWRDDNGILHWDITDPNPGTWTITGYTVDGQKEVRVFAIPIARPEPLGTISPNGLNGFFAGQIAYDNSDGNYYVITNSIPSVMVNDLHSYTGSVLRLDDTSLSIEQIYGYFHTFWNQTNTPEWGRYYYLWASCSPSVYIYCLGDNVELSFETINNCQSITLNNNTPVHLQDLGFIWPQVWSNFAYAVFVTDSAGMFVYSTIIENTVNYPQDITFPIPGDGIYNVYVFLQEKYLPYLSYIENDIVFYNGQFCIVQLGSFDPIPLTLAGLTIFQNNWNIGGGWNGSFYSQVTVICDIDSGSFSTSIDNDCTELIITDVTSWPVNLGTINRDDCGIALWYTYNGIIYNDFSNMGTNITSGQWIIPIIDNGIYNVSMFIIPLWIDGSWSTNEITFDNGNFYISTTPHVFGDPNPSLDITGWRLLNDTDYNTFYNNWNGNNPSRFYSFIQKQVNITCFGTNEFNPELSNVINSACHLFSIINTLPDNGRNVVVKVYPFDMSEVLQCGIIDVINGSTSIDFVTPEDGVYVFQIGYQPIGTTDCEIDYEDLYLELPKYDFCDVQSCYFRLVQMLLCNELDPCCQNCDPAFVEQRKIYREELNKMLALMFTLYGFLNVDQLNYLHFNQLYSYDMSSGEFTPLVPDRNMLIRKIQDIINKLRDIAGRCGDCNGPREDITVKQPCTNCGGSR